MAMLEVKDLQVYYGVIQALKGISFHVNQGEVIALIGANGAGKTTILHTVTGLINQKAGKIEFEGKDISHTPAYKIVAEGMAHVPEGRRVFAELSVYDNLMMGAYTRKDKKEIAETLAMVYKRFPRLEERKKQMAGTLSGGEQQMLAIARGLMSCPKVLMLDEPSLGIAPVIVDKLFEIIAQLKKENMTILISEQNVGRVLDIGDDAIVVQSGRIVMSGTCEEIKNSDMIQKAYLGM